MKVDMMRSIDLTMNISYHQTLTQYDKNSSWYLLYISIYMYFSILNRRHLLYWYDTVFPSLNDSHPFLRKKLNIILDQGTC